jgi:hypothetical protein
MDPDLILVVGIVLTILCLPSLLSAFAESRPPRTAAILGLAGAIMIVVAVQNYAPGYRISDIPDVFMRVIGRYIN